MCLPYQLLIKKKKKKIKKKKKSVGVFSLKEKQKGFKFSYTSHAGVFLYGIFLQKEKKANKTKSKRACVRACVRVKERTLKVKKIT